MDIEPDIITGAELLAAHHGLDNVEFLAADFLKGDLGLRFDVGMMIDFLGRGMVTKNKLPACVAALKRLTTDEMLVTLRPEYPLANLRMTADGASTLYGAAFVTPERFLLLDYVKNSLGPDWRAEVRPTRRSEEFNLKTPVRLWRT